MTNPVASEVTANTMRVMTWNLWWRFGPWQQRQQAIEATIRSVSPDVVMLQECWREGDRSIAADLAASLGYHAAETDDPFPGREVGFHNALLSRWPLEAVDSVALPNADHQPGHRRLLLADTRTPWGLWPIASTHLDHRFDDSALRQSQATALLQAIGQRRNLQAVANARTTADELLPLVLGGDLNAPPDSDEIRLLTGRKASPVRGLVLSDCWEQVGSSEHQGRTWRDDNPYRVDTAWPNRRIDYVMVAWPRPKPIGNPTKAWLVGVDPVLLPDGEIMASDHAAVVVELRTTGSISGLG